jgi:hypothetical protein
MTSVRGEYDSLDIIERDTRCSWADHGLFVASFELESGLVCHGRVDVECHYCSYDVDVKYGGLECDCNQNESEFRKSGMES